MKTQDALTAEALAVKLGLDLVKDKLCESAVLEMDSAVTHVSIEGSQRLDQM